MVAEAGTTPEAIQRAAELHTAIARDAGLLTDNAPTSSVLEG
jgi:hypothetical protein